MSRALVTELLALTGLAAAGTRVAISGEDPVFPTRFRVGVAGAAAIAATAAAAAELHAVRKGVPQAVAVDLRHAAAALRSARYLRIDGRPPAPLFDPLSGLYPAAEGRWVFLHCNFPNHRAAATGVLGLPADAPRSAVAEAVRGSDGLALEDAVHEAGGCAGFVRSVDEWQAHPQSMAVAGRPLIEIERIGGAPPEPLPPGERPLSGIRVLDVTRVLAGPTCARTLAEHGADVLKVSGPHLPHSGEVEIDTGLGKLSSFLDLRQAAERDRLVALIRHGRCDVFSQGYRPGALAGRGFGAAELAALRPGIIYAELSAWGRDGPWRGRRGFDTVVQCVSGMAMTEGGRTAPRLLPVSALDYVTGYLMALGAITALLRRAREGGSWSVRLSLARTRQWIVDQGLIGADLARTAPAELSATEIARFAAETPSSLGLIRHLRPVAEMSETPPFWARPPVALGSDPPAWP